MSAFRYKLKQHITPLHERLESHERMRAYVRRDGAKSDYLAVLKRLYGFWSANVPAGRLPAVFHQFHNRYLEALAEDIGRSPERSFDVPVKRHEVAFFYVLLGSSLGARTLLKQGTRELPQKNLMVLADAGGSLWREFLLNHLINIETSQEPEILQSTEQMFHDLYRRISAFDPEPI